MAIHDLSQTKISNFSSKIKFSMNCCYLYKLENWTHWHTIALLIKLLYWYEEVQQDYLITDAHRSRSTEYSHWNQSSKTCERRSCNYPSFSQSSCQTAWWHMQFTFQYLFLAFLYVLRNITSFSSYFSQSSIFFSLIFLNCSLILRYCWLKFWSAC